MRTLRPFAAILAVAAATALPALAAGAAPQLSVAEAEQKSATFAERVCGHDTHCVGHGVVGCRRSSPRVVLCRIFDERSTRVQGRYRCERQVRIALDPASGRTPVTGLGRWSC